MKKFFFKILLFFAIVIFIDFCVGHLGDYLQLHAKGGDSRALNDFVMKDNYDIVIFGSSRAHHHYDTPFLSDTLDMNIYNAGYDGNGIILACGLLELIIDRYHPKLIIYDVEPIFDINEYEGDNNHKRYIKNLKPFFRNDSVASIIKDISCEEWYKVHSGMIRYNSDIISLIMDNLIARPTPSMGYVPLHGSLSSYSSEDDAIENKIDYFKLKYFEKMISLVKKNNIPIVVLASPMYGARTSSSLSPVFDICKKKNIRVYDYYIDSRFQHMELFHDAGHMNEKGAREFSRQIICDFLQ